MLIKKESRETPYCLPVVINGKYKTNFYYDCEFTLFKAYRQLKAIKSNIHPLYPIIYDTTYLNA